MQDQERYSAVQCHQGLHVCHSASLEVIHSENYIIWPLFYSPLGKKLDIFVSYFPHTYMTRINGQLVKAHNYQYAYHTK